MFKGSVVILHLTHHYYHHYHHHHIYWLRLCSQLRDPESILDAEANLWPSPTSGRCAIPLSIIPAGSGNGLAATINCRSVVDAALRIIHNRTTALDLMRVELLPSPLKVTAASTSRSSSSAAAAAAAATSKGATGIQHKANSQSASTSETEALLSNSDLTTSSGSNNSDDLPIDSHISASVAEDSQAPRRVVYAFLQVSYGVMCDVDFDSEFLRWMGDARFLIFAIKSLIQLPHYHCSMTFAPWLVKHVVPISALLPPADGERKPVDPGWVNNGIDKAVLLPPQREQERLIRSNEPEGYYWIGMINTRTFADGFIGSPFIELNDGTFEMLVVPAECSRWQLLSQMVKLASGMHPLHKEIPYYSVCVHKRACCCSGCCCCCCIAAILIGCCCDSTQAQAH
jgi:hypothetical protein